MGFTRKLSSGFWATTVFVGLAFFGVSAFCQNGKNIPPRERQFLDTLAQLEARAHDYEKRGLDAKAEEAYQQVLAFSPRSLDPWVHLGKIYLRQGRNNEAYNALDRLMSSRDGVSTDQYDPVLNYRFAVLCRNRHETAKENAAYRRILAGYATEADRRILQSRLRPDNDSMALVHTKVATEYLDQIHDFEKAKEHVQLAFSLNAKEPATQTRLASIADRVGMHRESRMLLRQVAAPPHSETPVKVVHFPLSDASRKEAAAAIAAAQNHAGKRGH